jgi:hypothetical protein
LELIFLILLSAIIYAILSSVKNGFLKRSRLLKSNRISKQVYLSALLEAVISSIGLLAAVLIVNSFTETALSDLLTFGLGAFTCFYLVRLWVFKSQQKPAAK